MTDFLVFTLAAPMASFGGLAVGERRPSGDHPTKSQVIGLVAAALGIPRADEQRQRALAVSLGYAVRVDDPGLPASDYHTAQTTTDVSLRRRAKEHGAVATRRDELACDDLKTVLSMREYRAGILATVLVWLCQACPATLAEMRAGLRAPKFTLFAGRKAFPLMLPCRPEIVAADTIEDALSDYDASRSVALQALHDSLLVGRLPRRDARSRLYADEAAPTALRRERLGICRDVAETRAKWRFAQRTEVVLALPVEEAIP